MKLVCSKTRFPDSYPTAGYCWICGTDVWISIQTMRDLAPHDLRVGDVVVYCPDSALAFVEKKKAVYEAEEGT